MRPGYPTRTLPEVVTPHTARPVPSAITRVCSVLIAEVENSITVPPIDDLDMQINDSDMKMPSFMAAMVLQAKLTRSYVNASGLSTSS